MFKLLRNSLIACFLIVSVGCVISENRSHCKALYTFGDATYAKKLAAGVSPIKLGPIAADKVPANFPRKFLEADGSYGGGRVFCSVAEAEQAVLEAKEQNMINANEEWGVYLVDGDWKTYAYELHPNDFRLRSSRAVIKRVH